MLNNKFFRRFRFRRSPQALSLLLTLVILLGCAAVWALNPAFRSKTAGVENEPAQEFEQDPEKKLDWFYFQRTYPSGTIPNNARLNAWNRRPASVQGPQALGWTPLGPAPTTSDIPQWGLTSGRINAIAVSPADPNLILVGASTGGLWRSTDGGTTFVPVSDSQVDLAVASIAFAASTPTIVYAGMGDRGSSYLGTGVLKSTDSGQTWTRVSDNTLPAPGRISTIAVNPADPNQVYVAQYVAQDGAFTTAAGFYRSTNGGVTWTRTLSGLARDLALRPNVPGTIYLAMQRTDENGLPAGVFRSTDSGATWLNVYPSPYTTTSNIKVGVTPANDAMVYVYIGGSNAGGLETRVEVSTNSGANFTNRGNTGLDTGQFTYNNYLAVSPANANTIYVGTRDVYKSTDGGVSYANLNNNFDATGVNGCADPSGCYHPAQSNAHPDQHCLAFAPGNANTLFIGNDGGLYRSTDGGTNFANVNAALSLTQFVGYALHPTDALRSYGGMQDNGSQKRLNANTPGGWREFTSGDGGRTVINPLDPTVVFSTYIFGSITRWQNNAEMRDFPDVGTNATFGEPANGARIAFYPPFTGNKVNSTLYFGTWRLFVSTNLGDTWTAPGGMTDLTAGDPDVLSAIGVARSNPNVIYTGSRQGSAMVSTNGGANWTNITAGLPTRSITGITVSPTFPSQAYLTVSGYGTGHIFLTNNSGGNWTDISNNLPDIPTNALLIDPLTASTLYAGTDIGVFRSTNGGTAWNTFNNGLPPVVVSNFDAQASGRIQLASYGRGAYELVNTLPDCPAVTGLAPTTGAVGSQVVITGTNLTGVTTVRFGGNINAVNPTVTDTQITAIVPAGAQSGAITLIKAGCPDALSANFTVNGTCPNITITGTLPNGTVGTAYPASTLTAAGDGPAYTFTVSVGALPPGLQLQAATATTATVSGTPTTPGAFNFSIRARDNASNCVRDQAYTVNIASVGLQFFPLPQPVRLLETRAGFTGCTMPGVPINANGTLTLPARTTCAGIPAAAAAVTGNITVVPSGPGFLTLFPSSATQPTVANSNFQTNEITNNVFTVGLGTGDGAFKIFSSATTHVIVDVTGYYAPPNTGGLYFHPLATPVRLLETRLGFTGCIAPGTPLVGTGNPNADPNLDLSLQGRSPVAAPCNSIPATAQVLVGNATSVLPNGGGYLTIYPSGGTRPTVASSNYAGVDVINGPFAVKLGTDGKFKIYTFATTNLVVDILGYHSTDATDANGAGLLFNPLPSPVRLLETRAGFNGCTMTGAPIVGNLANATHTQMAANFCGLPAAAQAVVGNVSVVNTTGAGFLTLFPANLTTAPLVATSNYPAPATFGYNRHFFVGLSPADGKFKVLTQFTTDLILDASGYFAP